MASDAADGGRPWLVCRVGSRLCALPLTHVIETMRPLPIEPVAGAPVSVRGLTLSRGMPIPVVDLFALFGEAAEPRRMVTVATGDRRAALLVGEVLGVRNIAPAALAAMPPLLRDAVGEAVSGIGTLDREMLLLVEAARLVPDQFDMAQPA